MAAIHFESSLDNSKLIAGVNQANKTVDQFVNNVQNQGTKIDNTFRNMAASAGAYFSLQFGANLVKEIISVRGEFQQLGIAFETMLGSKEKADRLMSEAVTFAAKTPFTLTDVASNIKQLMAMGIATEDVMSTMKSLGDVAAGVSVPIARVAINYGQVATMGKLQGRELRDFAMAGIPLIDELAKNLGKAKNEIDEMVTAGKIGFKDVEKAFQTMAGEGGKFFNLMEKQNASVTGQISNLSDKWQVMLNEIGKGNEGLIYGGISGLAGIISNYEQILNGLKVIIATYGTYRAALIAVSIAQSYQAAAAAAQVFTMTGVLSKLTFAQYASAKAQAVLNGVISMNPYVMAAMALAAIGSALYLFTNNVSDAEKAQIKLNETINDEKAKIETLVTIIKSENSAQADRAKALKELNSILPDSVGLIDAQTLSTKKGKAAIDDYIDSVRKRAEIEQLTADLKKNLDDQDRVMRGDLTTSEKFQNDIAIVGSKYDPNLPKAQSAIIFAYKEQEQAIKAKMEAVLSDGKAENKTGKEILTVSQQIINATKAKKEAESELNEMRKAGSKSSKKDIEDQIATVEEYKKTIEVLTGINDKISKKNKEDAELENRIKATEEAMKTASGQKLKDLAAGLSLLEKELELRTKILKQSNQSAWTDQFKGESMTPMTSDGTKPISKIGAVKLSDIYNHTTGQYEKVLFEMTEIDKKGRETFSKVKLETKKLFEQATDLAKKAKKDQEKLDEDAAKQKAEIQKEIISGARQLTGEMIDQLNISDKQKEMLQKSADAMANMAAGLLSGNPADMIAAGFSAASLLIPDVFTAEERLMQDAQSIVDLYKLQNFELEKQIDLLNASTGSERISQEKRTFEMIKRQQEELQTAATKLQITASKTESSGLFGWGSKTESYILTEKSPFETIDKWVETIKTLDNLSIQGYVLTGLDEVLALIDEYNNLEKERIMMLEELTATTSIDITSLISDGFANGKSAIADFADDFEGLMKGALINIFKTQYLANASKGFFDQFAALSEEGLTKQEIETLKLSWSELIAGSKKKMDEITAISGIDISSTQGDKSSLTGQIKGVSEDTASMIAGRLMAVNNDMKKGLEIGYDSLDVMNMSVGHLDKIQKNTFDTVQQLIISNSELVKMNATLKAQL